MGNSGRRQFLQRTGRRRRPRRKGSFPTAACSVPYRRMCRRRPIRCKNCRCPELPTCPEFPPFTLPISVCTALLHWRERERARPVVVVPTARSSVRRPTTAHALGLRASFFTMSALASASKREVQGSYLTKPTAQKSRAEAR